VVEWCERELSEVGSIAGAQVIRRVNTHRIERLALAQHRIPRGGVGAKSLIAGAVSLEEVTLHTANGASRYDIPPPMDAVSCSERSLARDA